eukprot:m.166819 g.166819  ORF g.166819 m.166819 type:complete len:200 (+) comp15294_c0_seq3:570-1169(+)
MSGCNNSAVVNIRGGTKNEIKSCTIDGMGKAGRSVWLIATSYAFVSYCKILNSIGHSLDFDAYTSSSTAYNNLCMNNGEQGIFVEETANGNFIVGNTVQNNTNGINLYSNAVGPVTKNIIAYNTIINNRDIGLSSGGYGHAPNKVAVDNIFVGNVLHGNPTGAQVSHGPVQGDLWINNNNSDGWTRVPENKSMALIFEP